MRCSSKTLLVLFLLWSIACMKANLYINDNCDKNNGND